MIRPFFNCISKRFYSVSASAVKELRVLSGAPIIDCKKALEEVNGNLDEATKILYAKGLSAAEKRMSNNLKATVGLIGVAKSSKGFVLAEVCLAFTQRLAAKLISSPKTSNFSLSSTRCSTEFLQNLSVSSI